ncbi:hypothetical protein JHK84_047880 [Glycine max]|nr:hypothetical protein JHK84_047880 [Glycine max]
MTKFDLCLSSGPPPLDDKRVRITVRYLRVSSGPPPLDDTRVQNDQTCWLCFLPQQKVKNFSLVGQEKQETKPSGKKA